eukprot:1564253-Amphidinium_carterae.1
MSLLLESRCREASHGVSCCCFRGLCCVAPCGSARSTTAGGLAGQPQNPSVAPAKRPKVQGSTGQDKDGGSLRVSSQRAWLRVERLVPGTDVRRQVCSAVSEEEALSTM